MVITEIHIKGKLDPGWSDWFEEMQIESSKEETVLRGSLPDQSSVYGVISRLSSLGLTLISLTCREEKE
jgi:hypothetical protein